MLIDIDDYRMAGRVAPRKIVSRGRAVINIRS